MKTEFTEFMVWWKDSESMKYIVEAYTRVHEAFARVKELQKNELEVLPVIRHTVEV